jgi:hypothetical protein
VASVNGFTSTSKRVERQSTVLRQAPENFADVAATIADAASELSGKTIVVKYGGVRGSHIDLTIFSMFRPKM